jgi:hypothetical protein
MAPVSTNMCDYSVLIKTTDDTRTLVELYNWVQYQLLQETDIDSGAGEHLGYITDALMSMPAATSAITTAGVWIEGFDPSDNNYIQYTDDDDTVHTPITTITVSVITAAAMDEGQVAIFALDTPGLDETTYTPANIDYTILNAEIEAPTTTVVMTYTADIPVRVVTRKAGYAEFQLFTTIGSTGLIVTSQNAVDGAY